MAGSEVKPGSKVMAEGSGKHIPEDLSNDIHPDWLAGFLTCFQVCQRESWGDSFFRAHNNHPGLGAAFAT